MKVNREELLSALEKVKPGLANREIIEQSTSFAFLGDRVVTYNDEISISHPVQGLDVTGAVKAQILYTFLGRIKRKEINISWEENQVMIRAGRARAGLALEAEVLLPIQEIGEIQGWQPIPGDLMTALKFCHPCCSNDMSKPVLTCVHVTPTHIEASDSYQIILYHLANELALDSFLIPASAVQSLLKYSVTEIALGEGWVHFRTEDGTVFSARTFTGKFPDITPYLNPKGQTYEFPQEMGEILERADVFARSKGKVLEHTPMVTIDLGKNRIRASVENTAGWFRETTKTEYDGEPIQFSVIIEFLQEIFKETMTCVIDEKFLGFAGEKWRHVVAMTVHE